MGQARGLAQVLCPLLWWCCVHSTLLLLLIPQKWQLGFGFLYLVISMFQLCMHTVLVPYSFFVLCCLENLCPGSTSGAKGPKSEVSACQNQAQSCLGLILDPMMLDALFWRIFTEQAPQVRSVVRVHQGPGPLVQIWIFPDLEEIYTHFYPVLLLL